MQKPIGESQTNNISSNTDLTHKPAWHLAILLGAGMLIAILHQSFHWPLKMPGHHGMELMAIMMLVRQASPYRYAATTASFGNVLVSSIFSHEQLIQQIIFILQGLLIDKVYPSLDKRRNHLGLHTWVIGVALLAGAAHTIKPMVKWMMQTGLNIPAGSLVNGLAFPTVSHLIFGFIGGAIGALAWRSYKAYHQKK
jgi:hypothetical protein